MTLELIIEHGEYDPAEEMHQRMQAVDTIAQGGSQYQEWYERFENAKYVPKQEINPSRYESFLDDLHARFNQVNDA